MGGGGVGTTTQLAQPCAGGTNQSNNSVGSGRGDTKTMEEEMIGEAIARSFPSQSSRATSFVFLIGGGGGQ